MLGLRSQSLPSPGVTISMERATSSTLLLRTHKTERTIMIRSSKAVWKGSGKEGNGKLTSTSGVLKETPYSFETRFVSEDGKAGTNPEELIAAAHAGCFTMKLSFLMGNKGFTPDELDCTSEVKLGPVEGGTGITGIHLVLNAKVPGISQADFDACAEDAKVNCPISQVLKAVPITLSATLAK